jgi:acetyl esterase/lipase
LRINELYCAVVLATLALVCQWPALSAEPTGWQPSPGHTQIPIWPSVAPDVQSDPGPETSADGAVTNVTRPTMTLYSPSVRNTVAAVVVIPGGGFVGLAMDFEASEACDWLTSKGVTCVLLKYRVPSAHFFGDPIAVRTIDQYRYSR